jgi:tRNA(adenine34) deaminase
VRAVPQSDRDGLWMGRVLTLAEAASRSGEWPFGAIVVRPDRHNAASPGAMLSGARSTERGTGNPAGHAELHAIEQASGHVGGAQYWPQGALIGLGMRSFPLLGCTLYTNHEPCVMCSGVIRQAKLSRVVVGTLRASCPHLFRPQRVGFVDLMEDANPDYPIEVVIGVREAECLALFEGMVDDAPSVAA